MINGLQVKNVHILGLWYAALTMKIHRPPLILQWANIAFQLSIANNSCDDKFFFVLFFTFSVTKRLVCFFTTKFGTSKA